MRHHGAGLLALLLSWTLVLQPLGAAGYGEHAWWVVKEVSNFVDEDAGTCGYGARVGLLEIGKSGVIRMRVQFQRKFLEHSLPYRWGDWQESIWFPDDERSWWDTEFRAWYYVSEVQKRYLQAKMVWDVASFWRFDRVEKAVVARCDGGDPCTGVPGGMGPQT